MANKKNNLELKKHVATIHSSNKLSLVQRKISNALLYNAYDDLLNKDEHSIHIATLCKLIGYDSNDHKTIRKALVDLLSTVLEWNIVDADKYNQADAGIWNASSIIADASINGPLCTYSYSNKMKQLLYRPELYGRLNMAVQARFKSSYGLALYENCIRYQDIGQTPVFEILKFRKLMGIEEGRYKIFRDFKLRVLDKAVEEVNVYSPIRITAKLRKQGRQVTAIQFLIVGAEKVEFNRSSQNNTHQSLPEKLKNNFGFSKRQIENVLMSYSEEYINEKIMIIEESLSFKTGKIHNLAKYLLSAIEEDYQSTSMKPFGKHTQASPIDNKMPESIRVVNEIKKAYAEYKENRIDVAIKKLKGEKRQLFMNQFYKEAADSIKTVINLQGNKYTADNIIESPHIKALLRNFAKEKLPLKSTKLFSIDEFIETLSPAQQAIWKKERALEEVSEA